MDLFVIRHAEAVPADPLGSLSDAERPLTEAGFAQARALAATLTALDARPEVIVASPLLRARQTAEVIRDGLCLPPELLLTCDHLEPGGRARRLSKFVRGLNRGSVAVVGHQPDLAEYLGWLIGSRKLRIEFPKAGVARVDCPAGPEKSGGYLVWMLTPELFLHAEEDGAGQGGTGELRDEAPGSPPG